MRRLVVVPRYYDRSIYGRVDAKVGATRLRLWPLPYGTHMARRLFLSHL